MRYVIARMWWAFCCTAPIGGIAGIKDVDGVLMNALLLGTVCAFVVGIPVGLNDWRKSRQSGVETLR